MMDAYAVQDGGARCTAEAERQSLRAAAPPRRRCRSMPPPRNDLPSRRVTRLKRQPLSRHSPSPLPPAARACAATAISCRCAASAARAF